ncbi:sulfotransferase family 2 domain-containing protein [Lewinella sp. LCG006]|uniref:sulfotransferase family 2 domain-containing protein n=1 Tax=Lewinella sp. LCG006 TaxID=3231911 RepID=UPI0034600337
MTTNWLAEDRLEKFPAYKQFPSGIDVFFIHITKTAGTSIRHCLDFPRPRKSEGLFKKHYNHQEIQQLVDPVLWHNSFKFSFVRNPWDRLFSYYHYRKRNFFSKRPTLDPSNPNLFPNFADWLETYVVKRDISQTNLRPQYNWIYDNNGNLVVDFLGRFENLHPDFEKLKKILEVPHLQLEHENKTERPCDFRMAYNNRTKDIITTLYKKDIELFNYTF